MLHALATAPGRRLRFAALRRRIEGLTQRVLTVSLRDLERDGLVARHSFAEVPPRVEYTLTALGAGMLQALAGFADWIGASWPSIEAARRAFDGARGTGPGRSSARRAPTHSTATVIPRASGPPAATVA